MKWNKTTFVTKAIEIHGDKYDYSSVNYVNFDTLISIKCKYHNTMFNIKPSKHINRKQGCRLCGIIKCGASKRTPIEKIIEQAQIKHNNKYNYNNSIRNRGVLEDIQCPAHGNFNQVISSHLAGHGCKKCANDNLAITKSDTCEDFINKAIAVHGDKYDYKKAIYINQQTKIIIICPKHGEFEQLPCNHLNNRAGCKFCAIEINASNQRSDTEKFIKKANNVHNNYYDYSLTVYGLNSMEFVIITCPKHGKFKQSPSNHLSGYNCEKCGIDTRAEKKTKSNEQYISEVRIKHENKYDYSETLYTKWNEPIIIICKEHGSFTQVAQDHLQGCGCKKCSKIGYSRIACEWLTKISKEQNIYIQYALNDGEKKIGPYRVDGYCETTNTIYEFYGCLFHGCPRCYNPEKINPFNKKTMKEIYIKTQNREAYLLNNNYLLEVMWECDYKKIMKNNKKLSLT